MSLESGSHYFRNRAEHVCEFCVCVCVSRLWLYSGPPSLVFERGFSTPERLQYLITPPTIGSPCMTLSSALTHLTTAHHFVTGISKCTYWTSLPTGMRVGTKACQSDSILLGEQANGTALFGRYAYQSPAGLSVNGCSWKLALPAVIVIKWNTVRNITFS